MRAKTPAGVLPPCCSRLSWPLRGVDDGFDPLADPGGLPVPDRFVLAVRPHRVCAEALGDERFELLAREALVREDHLSLVDEVVAAFQQRGHHLPLADLWVGQAPGDGHSLGGSDQVETEAPEEAGVAAAEAVAAVPGQAGAFDGLAGGRAGQRGGVDQPQVVVPGRHLPGRCLDHGTGQRACGVEALVVGGLLVAEQVAEAGVGELQPVPVQRGSRAGPGRRPGTAVRRPSSFWGPGGRAGPRSSCFDLLLGLKPEDSGLLDWLPCR